MNYKEYKDMSSKKIDDLKGLFFAFNQEQLIAGIEKVKAQGFEVSKENKLVSVGAGGYVVKEQLEEFKQVISAKPLKKMMKCKAFAIDAFLCELRNHEYGYTKDEEPAVEALCYTMGEVAKSKVLSEAMSLACNLIKEENHV